MRVILPEIKELIAARNAAIIKKVASYFEPADIAEVWHEFTLDEKLIFFNALDKRSAADIFEFLEKNEMIELLNNLDIKREQEILNEISPDDRTDLFSIIPDEEVEKLIPLLEENEQIRARELLGYKGNTAGGLMTTDYIAVPESVKTAQALKELRRRAKDIDFIQNIYVVDRVNRLKGIIPLKILLTANPQKKVENLMETYIPSVNLEMDQEEVAKIFEKYDKSALPVIDKLGRIKGIITVDDILDVLKEETTEDLHRLGATGTMGNYLMTSFFAVAKKRAIWLVILALAGFISGAVLEHYSFMVSSVIILSFFIPILMDTAGNAGTQAATVVIRSLAIGEVRLKDAWRIVQKEFSVGILIGTVTGGITALRAIILNQNPLVAIIVLVSMVATMVFATVMGGFLPLVFQRMGLDPALMSGPLITTILDSVGLLVYFNTAIVVFHILK